MTIKNYLLAVDGDNALHRAYYGNPSTDAPKGVRLNGIKTFFSSINKQLRRNYYDHLTIAWDIRSERLLRTSLLAPYDVVYKEDRTKGLTEEQIFRREEIRQQKIVCHNLLVAMSIPSNLSNKKVNGVEADDILASISTQVKLERVDVLTSDKDLAQLLTEDKIQIYNPHKNKLVDEFECEEFFGVPPSQIVDLLCLVGDSADNVPGIRGCGPKTAIKLLNQYGSLEGIVANKKHIKGVVGKTLMAQDHLPIDVLRQVITVDTKVYKRKDPELDPYYMNLDRIRTHVNAHRDSIERIKSNIGFDGMLMAEIGI